MSQRLPIRFAADCPACLQCGEPWCELHQEHYADCPCPGPHSEEEEDEGPEETGYGCFYEK